MADSQNPARGSISRLSPEVSAMHFTLPYATSTLSNRKTVKVEPGGVFNPADVT